MAINEQSGGMRSDRGPRGVRGWLAVVPREKWGDSSAARCQTSDTREMPDHDAGEINGGGVAGADIASCGVRIDRPGTGPLVAVVLLTIATLVTLRGMGRVAFCACGEAKFFIADAWSSHTSQHLFDPYTPSHFSHGLIFYFVIAWAMRWGAQWGMAWREDALVSGTRRWGEWGMVTWALVIAMAIEAAWEIFENTPFVIDRYRAVTVSLDYSGDSVTNSLGDMVACFAGYVVARRLGFVRTALLFVGLELATLAWIKDNLTLNVVMLLYPIEAVKQWQMP